MIAKCPAGLLHVGNMCVGCTFRRDIPDEIPDAPWRIPAVGMWISRIRGC
ncbi:MAG: hypothetical protein K2G86_03140 [Prevotella sp.]|nr:hypothetical protein [Prevotella sp.]